MSFARCQYVSDDGNTYQRKCDAAIATAVGLTTEAIGAHPKLPTNIKPRYVLMARPSPNQAKFRKVVGMDASDGLFVGSTTTLTYPPEKGTTTGETLDRAGAVGEKRYER